MLVKYYFKMVYDFFRYDIPYGIKNIFVWLPIIWKDRNWDFIYIFILLQHKFNLMEKNIRTNNNHVDAEKTADGIKKCALLIDRIIKDGYHENAFKQHFKKWGRPEFDWIEDNNMNETLSITHPNIKTKEDELQEAKEYKIAYEKEAKLKEQDINMLFSEMRKKIQTWWD